MRKPVLALAAAAGLAVSGVLGGVALAADEVVELTPTAEAPVEETGEPEVPVSEGTETPEAEAPVEQTSEPPAPELPAEDTPAGFGEGVYEVGRDLQPGVFRTDGPTSDYGCAWYRLADNSGEFDAIIAMDVVDGPASVTVSDSDAFVKFTGSCSWVRDEDPAAPSTSDAPADDNSGDDVVIDLSGDYDQLGGLVPQGGADTGA